MNLNMETQDLKEGIYLFSLCVLCRGGQSTQLHYLSESTDTAGQILLHYKWKL